MLTLDHVALLISADLFCCGVTQVMQSTRRSKWMRIQ